MFVFLTHCVSKSLRNDQLFKRMVGHFGFGKVLRSARQSDMHVMPSVNCPCFVERGWGWWAVFIHFGTGNQAFRCKYRL